MPRHPSSGCTSIDSVPLGSRVTVVLLVVNGAMRHFPLSAPLGLVISTQCVAKYSGMLAVRSVTSVAPLLPAWAMPEVSPGRMVVTPLEGVTPLLSTVRSPNELFGPRTYTLPGAPMRPLKPEPPRAERFDSSVLPPVPVYSIETAPPPPPAYPLGTSPPRASTEPLPASSVAVIQIEPAPPLMSEPPVPPCPFARRTPSMMTAPPAMRRAPPPLFWFAPAAVPEPPPLSCG